MPSLVATLGANISPFTRAMDTAKAKARTVGTEIKSALGGEIGSRLAGIASVAAVSAGIDHAIEYAGRINDLSQRLGISTDAVQEWDYALKQNGSTIDAAASFFEKLAVARDKALKPGPEQDEMIRNFQKLGVEIANLKTDRLEQIGVMISEALKAGDPQELFSSLRAVGGKGAGEMIAALREGIRGLSDDARAFGQVMDENLIKKLDDAGDKIERFNQKLTANVFGPVAGGLSDAAEGLNDFFGGMAERARTILGLLTRPDPIRPGEGLLGMLKRQLTEIDEAVAKIDRSETDATQKRAVEAALSKGKKANGRTGFNQLENDAAEIDRLKKLTEEEERKGKRAAMNAAERAAADRNELDVLERKIEHEDNLLEKARLQLEAQKLRNQLQTDESSALKDASKESGGGSRDRQFQNQFTAIGGFGQNQFDSRLLDVQLRSEGHLSSIRQSTEASARTMERILSRGSGSEVQY